MKVEKLRKFEHVFNPRAVAVIGASNDDGFSRALMSTKIKDNLFLINPRYKELYGKRCYDSILNIEDGIDYVVIAVPTLLVPKVLAECVEKGVEAVHIYTAGFSETGLEERKILENEVKKISRGKVSVIGPNCMGIYCPKSGLTFFPDASAEEGSVGVISQSGTFAVEFLSTGKLRNIKFSKVVSYGNAIDLDCPDFLEYLAHDPETEVIALYRGDPKWCVSQSGNDRSCNIKASIGTQRGSNRAWSSGSIFSHRLISRFAKNLGVTFQAGRGNPGGGF
jgi:acyl-CoA synthetase (NDP forming)